MTVAEMATTPRLAGLADEMQQLYREARADVGAADLAHIRHVTAYGEAINTRRLELLRDGGPGAVRRASALEMLYRLLQFSELGHNILHGSYDHLPESGEFHSQRYQWDFNVDEAQWKYMHHEGHHPNTNIIGKDHDLGYSIVRGQPGQDWFGHHIAQLGVLSAILPVLPQVFPFLVANLARHLAGERFWSVRTLRAPVRIAARDTLRRLVAEPRAAGARFVPAALANYAGGVAGYAAVLILVAIEHHAGEVEAFADPGPEESHDEYYSRQIRATRNFLPSAAMDSALKRILEEEVPFENRPDFRVFYGGLDTHVEHHLFPDLPPNRQRQIAPRVKEIALRHGLPYHETPLSEAANGLLKVLTGLSLPVGEAEVGRPRALLRRPVSLARRVMFGATYRTLPESPYLDKPRWHNVAVQVAESRSLAGGRARLLRLRTPRGWEGLTWGPGAFVSLRVGTGEDAPVRQYSLIHDSDGSDTMDICVKRVPGGQVSGLLNDGVRTGSYLTVVGPPVCTGGLATAGADTPALFIAGGVGITPILSHLRTRARRGEPCDTTLLYFNHDADGILFEDDVRRLGQVPGIDVHVFAGRRPSAGLIAELVPDAAVRHTLVCAPPGLVDTVRDYLADMGQLPGLFHTESFTPPQLARPADDGSRYTVTFDRSGRTVEIDATTTLLEAANRAGVRVPTGCRSGLCRTCVTPKLSGVTHREASTGPTDRITVCDSLACSDITLDL